MVMDVSWCRLCVIMNSLRKGDSFVLSWEIVRRVRRGSVSSELLMCGGFVGSILLLPLVAIDVRIWHMRFQTTQPTSGGAVTAVLANCVDTSHHSKEGRIYRHCFS